MKVHTLSYQMTNPPVFLRGKAPQKRNLGIFRFMYMNFFQLEKCYLLGGGGWIALIFVLILCCMFMICFILFFFNLLHVYILA